MHPDDQTALENAIEIDGEVIQCAEEALTLLYEQGIRPDLIETKHGFVHVEFKGGAYRLRFDVCVG